jgi:hypothetical protein
VQKLDNDISDCFLTNQGLLTLKFSKEVNLSSRRLKTFDKLFSFKIVRGDEDYSAAE